jgi:hypothetical protein
MRSWPSEGYFLVTVDHCGAIHMPERCSAPVAALSSWMFAIHFIAFFLQRSLTCLDMLKNVMA